MTAPQHPTHRLGREDFEGIGVYHYVDAAGRAIGELGAEPPTPPLPVTQRDGFYALSTADADKLVAFLEATAAVEQEGPSVVGGKVYDPEHVVQVMRLAITGQPTVPPGVFEQMLKNAVLIVDRNGFVGSAPAKVLIGVTVSPSALVDAAAVSKNGRYALVGGNPDILREAIRLAGAHRPQRLKLTRLPPKVRVRIPPTQPTTPPPEPARAGMPKWVPWVAAAGALGVVGYLVWDVYSTA